MNRGSRSSSTKSDILYINIFTLFAATKVLVVHLVEGEQRNIQSCAICNFSARSLNPTHWTFKKDSTDKGSLGSMMIPISENKKTVISDISPNTVTK